MGRARGQDLDPPPTRTLGIRAGDVPAEFFELRDELAVELLPLLTQECGVRVPATLELGAVRLGAYIQSIP